MVEGLPEEELAEVAPPYLPPAGGERPKGRLVVVLLQVAVIAGALPAATLVDTP